MTASFTSRAPIFLPRYSGVRPTIWPARNIPMIMYKQHVDHAHALAAEDAVQPHAHHGRQGGNRD